MNFISGLKNCHMIGLDSLVMRNRTSPDSGMVRIFHNRACKTMENLYINGDYALAPHNHRQDITLHAIRGDVANLSFRVDRRTHDRYDTEFSFGSAIIDGKITAEYRDCVDLYLASADIVPFRGLFLPWRQVHTVLSSPCSAWVVVEGALSVAAHSLCYSRKRKLIFDQTDLYQEMTPADLMQYSDLYDDALEVLSRAGVSL